MAKGLIRNVLAGVAIFAGVGVVSQCTINAALDESERYSNVVRDRDISKQCYGGTEEEEQFIYDKGYRCVPRK